jgi:hypothetical protein
MANIALASKQRVFAVIERDKGAMRFPTGRDFISPVGNAVANQNPTFTDSGELSSSLDVLDQFSAAMPPADWRTSMYIRPQSFSTPQGAAILKSLFGSMVTASFRINGVEGLLNSSSGRAATFLTYDGLSSGKELPTYGVFLCGTEYISWSGITRTTSSTGTLKNLTRGYNNTTVAAHADDAACTMKGMYFKQATASSTFSLWIESDHFVQGISGASANQGVLRVTNEGGLQIDLTGQGMRMVWAGYDTMATQGFTAGTHYTRATVYVNDASIFSAGAYIYCPATCTMYSRSGVADNNNSAGYKILTSNATFNYLVISPAKTGRWATGDVIRGYLPTETKIGDVVEARDSLIWFNDVAATIKMADLTINCPKQYITDEVGTRYPQNYIEGRRDITSTAGIYFREADAKYFQEGYQGNNVAVRMTFGDTPGQKMNLYMKKTKLQVPTVTPAAPAIELSIPMKALGTLGEDSLELVIGV